MFVTLAALMSLTRSTLYICVEHTLAHIFKQKLINHHIWNISKQNILLYDIKLLYNYSVYVSLE